MPFHVTGSVKIFANPSSREKDAFAPSSFVDTTMSQETMDGILRDLRMSARDGVTDISESAQNYLDRVNATPTSAKNSVALEIQRFTPTVNHTENTEKKLFVEERLMPFYRPHRANAQWAYPNYHTVNFFTSDDVPAGAAWLYPNVQTDAQPRGCYSPTGSFTVEFFINPRYTSTVDDPFPAGTLLHLSSSLALSLVAGTSTNDRNETDGFRLMLQLSSSADVRPSVAAPGGQPYTYLSDDNALTLNTWHHVLVTWGTRTNDAATGSFYVDGVRRGTFVFDANTILPVGAVSDPDVLCVGNFYEGSNFGTSEQLRFFARDTARREGLYELDPTPDVDYPDSFTFQHPLSAEFHDLSLREEYVPPTKARALGSLATKRAPADLSGYMFYLPPFFVPGTPFLTVVNGQGGVLVDPFNSRDGANEHPFSVDMSFGAAGKYNSLENFTRDFATGRHARLLALTTSVILTQEQQALTANDILYATASVRLRNLNVLPCDDGNFRPNFELASTLDLPKNPRFVDDLGAPEPALISLRNMVSGSIYASLFSVTGSGGGVVSTPLEVPPGLLTVYQNTQDASSNEVVMFDVSNLFYGERIRPGSLVMSDPYLTGSGAAVGMVLRDDGRGGLYRGDCRSQQATWNHVGNVFYEEGIVLVKSPAVPSFGWSGFDMEFEGEKSVHVSKLNVLIDATSYNTSSNPSWDSAFSASFDTNRDPENQKFVTITGVNFHDDDLNVVMRAQLAQPIVKRKGDRYLLRVRYDW